MLDLNPTAEQQIIAKNNHALVIFPRGRTGRIKRLLEKIKERELEFVAIALINHSPAYIYDWRRTLENKYWLAAELEMVRRPSREFRGKLDAVLAPAKTRYAPMASFENFERALVLFRGEFTFPQPLRSANSTTRRQSTDEALAFCSLYNGAGAGGLCV